jgi:AcrR family transcriptional regulator
MALPDHLKARREPQQERSRALVDAILEATGLLLVERGFEALTVSDIAERAGVSPGSLYQYFPHREAIVAALIERQANDETASVMGALMQARPTRAEEALEAGIHAVLAFRARNPALQQALTDSVAWLGRYHDLQARGARVLAQLKMLLAPLYRPRPGGPSLDGVVFILGNAIHSLTHEGLLRRPADLDDGTLGREITALALGYLRGLERPSGEGDPGA